MIRWLVALAVFLMPSVAFALNCSSNPFTLTNGQTADATQVMANFNNILNCANNNLAHSGANSDITSLSGLSTPLSVAQGGTGVATFPTTNGVIIGNGVTNLSSVAPSTNGNVLTSNGTSWISTTLPAQGVTSIANSTNGGLNFSAATGAVVANIKPSDLLTKTTITTADSIVIMDAAGGNAAKTETFNNIFPQTQAANGTITMPGGTIIQWFTANVAATSSPTITFPTAFPNNCFVITTGLPNFSGGGSGWNGVTPHLKTITKTNFVADNSGNADTLNNMMFIAIGN